MDDEQQMPCWYYEREELYKTPSFYDNITHETEVNYRRAGARFLFDVSSKLKLGYDTCASAIVFFHRFYMFHSFKAFPLYVTAACCLMLAGKVEETPKKVRDIVKTARSLLSDADFEAFGSDPREEVMAYERVLLKTIKFDLQVTHPYSFLLQFATRIKGNQEKLKELVQMSWSFINDSLATTLCLQWEPEIIACAVLYLATRMLKFTIEDWEGRKPGLRWWECFVDGMSTEVMEDICHKILDLYPSDTGPLTSSTMTSNSTVASNAHTHSVNHINLHSTSTSSSSSSSSSSITTTSSTANMNTMVMTCHTGSQHQTNNTLSTTVANSHPGMMHRHIGGASEHHHHHPQQQQQQQHQHHQLQHQTMMMNAKRMKYDQIDTDYHPHQQQQHRYYH